MSEGKAIFFSGIGGSGMSALASFMAAGGADVSGSDRAFDADPNNPIAIKLRALGVRIAPQDGTGITSGLGLLVASAAVEQDRPEFKRASGLGIETIGRSEFLRRLAAGHRTIAVAGTSGKSTTSGMLSHLMNGLGMSPSLISGGRVKNFITDKSTGNWARGTSDWLVIEACESDRMIAMYRAEHTMLLNLHLDHQSIEETSGLFRELIVNTSGHVVYNADDALLAQIAPAGAVGFSIRADSDYRAEGIELHGLHSSFKVNGTSFRIDHPGEHNVLNALACIALLGRMGVALDDIAAHLPRFLGIDRRFDIHLNEGGKLVIDDYAHNPHKIESLMRTVAALSKRTCYMFQPHGYGPTRLMRQGYIDTFNSMLRPTDRLLILPIYYAGGTVQTEIGSADLADGITMRVDTPQGRSDILSEVKKSMAGFDCFVVFGARDESLGELAAEIALTLKHRTATN